jgi:hypothetical protein
VRALTTTCQGNVDDAKFGAAKSFLVSLVHKWIAPHLPRFQQQPFMLGPDGTIQRTQSLDSLQPAYLTHMVANLLVRAFGLPAFRCWCLTPRRQPLSPEELQELLELPDEFSKMETLSRHLTREGKVAALRDEYEKNIVMDMQDQNRKHLTSEVLKRAQKVRLARPRTHGA